MLVAFEKTERKNPEKGNKENMKTVRMIIMAMTVMVMLAGSAMAAGGPVPPTPVSGPLPDSLWMIVSKKALTSYAKERVAQAASYGNSASVMLPGGKTWAQVVTNSPDIRVITQLLGKEILSYRITDPTADQYFYAQLMDDAGWGLFWGWTQFKLENVKGFGWRVPKGATYVQADILSWQIPIYAPGVDNAYAVVVDKDGNQRYVYLTVQNGRLMYPTSLAGFAGQVILSGGANAAAYNMGSGAVMPTTLVESSVQAAIKNLVPLDNPGQIISTPQSTNGQSENPWYQMKIAGIKNVTFYGVTSEGEVATSVVIRGIGSEPVTVPITPGKPLTVTFDAATDAIWDIWFVYPSFGKDTPVIPPDQGGIGG